MMTDEQAAFLAAATALQGSPITQGVSTTLDVHKVSEALGELATEIYKDMRNWNLGREHDELQDRTAMNQQQMKDSR